MVLAKEELANEVLLLRAENERLERAYVEQLSRAERLKNNLDEALGTIARMEGEDA